MPIDTQVHLISEQAPLTTAEFVAIHDVPYHKAVSVLNWAALTTHPDIAFAISTITRFVANPRPIYWEAIKWIFHYLTGTCDLWLSYSETKHTLIGYMDTDSSMAEDRCAISGYIFLIDGSAISWSFKWQEIVSLSMMESEYDIAMHGMKEVL
jgi:hypothetical protein